MKNNISVTVECFIRKEDKYLMLLRNQTKKLIPGLLVAPGGHKKFIEGVFACAKREIMEETGVKVDNIRLKATGIGHCRTYNKNVEFCNYFLMSDYISGEPKKIVEDGKLQWLTLNEIKNHNNLFVEIKELLPYLFDDSAEVVSYVAEYDDVNLNKPTRFIIE